MADSDLKIRIKDLPGDPATEADLIDGYILPLDGPQKTKRLPGSLLAPRSGSTSEIRNLPDKNEGYIALNDGNGTGKFDINTIFNNLAPAFDPLKENGPDGYAYHAGEFVIYSGAQYRFLTDKTKGAWNSNAVTRTDLVSNSAIKSRLAPSGRTDGALIRANGAVEENGSFSLVEYTVSGDGVYEIDSRLVYSVVNAYAVIGVYGASNNFIPLVRGDAGKLRYNYLINTIGLNASKIVVCTHRLYTPPCYNVNYSNEQIKQYVANCINTIDFSYKVVDIAKNAGATAYSITKIYNTNTVYDDNQFGGTFTKDVQNKLLVFSVDLTAYVGTSRVFRFEVENPDYVDGLPFVNKLVFSRNAGWPAGSVIRSPLTPSELKQRRVRYEITLKDEMLGEGESIYLVWGCDVATAGTNKITYRFYSVNAIIVWATSLGGHTPDEYYTKPEVDAMLPTQKVIDCVGDSLTNSGTWEAELETLLGSGWSMRNLGMGGQNVGTILGRVNVFPWTVKTDFNVPATVTPAQIELTNENGGFILPCINWPGDTHLVSIGGIEGTLSTTQTDPSAASATYYFTRSEAGNSATIKAGTSIYVKNYKKNGTTEQDEVVANDKSHYKIIWMGQNGGCGLNDADRYAGSWCGSDANFERYVTYLDMCRDILGDKMLVLTPTSNTNDTYEEKMARKFGNMYFNVRKNLMNDGLRIAYECGYVASPDPTEDDAQDIADGKIPRTLRADGVHLNTTGYKTLAQMLYNVIQVVWNVG